MAANLCTEVAWLFSSPFFCDYVPPFLLSIPNGWCDIFSPIRIYFSLTCQVCFVSLTGEGISVVA